MKASRVALGVGAILFVAGGGAYAYLLTKKPLLEAGVGYAARVACGCRFIGNRTLADCKKDFEPGMEPISLSENVETGTVTATVPLMVNRSAHFDPVLGCQLEPLTR